MSKVYRIQSKQDRTRGAYSTLTSNISYSDVVNNMANEHGMNSDVHPTVGEDIGRDIEDDEHCGCGSAADLLRWFRGWIPRLLQVGYEIVVLHDVTITAVGEYQVLFTFD